MDQKGTSRKIFFYRAAVRDKKDNVIPFDPVALMKCIQALPKTTDGRSLHLSEKTRLTAVPYSVDPPRLRFGKAQLADYPYEETKELEWKDLQLGSGSGTADLTHVAFYPNGIVGQVFNYRAPHISRLSGFLELRCKSIIPSRIDFLPLVRRDALKRILGMEKIRSVRFTVEGGAADLLENAKGARPLLIAAREVSLIGRPYTIGVTISAIRDQESVREVVTDLAQNRALSGAVRQVHVEGSEYYTDDKKKRRARREQVDLLSRHFVFEESLLTFSDNKFTLDDKAAFERMDAIHAERRKELESAAHVA
jgi:hypothetical protein